MKISSSEISLSVSSSDSGKYGEWGGRSVTVGDCTCESLAQWHGEIGGRSSGPLSVGTGGKRVVSNGGEVGVKEEAIVSIGVHLGW